MFSYESFPSPPNTFNDTRVPWGGSDGLDLAWPARWPSPDVVWPDLEGPIADYPETLRAALDAPLGWERPWDADLKPGDRVALVIDDPSRWTPVREALPIVLERVHRAGIDPIDVSITVGVGRHRPVDRDGHIARLGRELVDRYRCYSPTLDDPLVYDDLGSSASGIPVRIFAPVARADLRILIGSVLPHLQAGFGGGWKLILPGTAHRSSLGAVHRFGLDPKTRRDDPVDLLGQPSRLNPMRNAIAEALARLDGPSLSISHVLGPPGTVLHVAAGEPEAVQEHLEAHARRRFQAPLTNRSTPEAPNRPHNPNPAVGDQSQAQPESPTESEGVDLVVAGNHPWPGDPMQSFKVLLQNRADVRPGGVIVGLFWTDPEEIERSMPLSSLRRIAVTGTLGSWAIHRLLPRAGRTAHALKSPKAFLIDWARELVVDRTVLVYAPELRRRLGRHLGPVGLFDDLPTLWRAVEAVLGSPPQNATLLPIGGLTYTPSSKTARIDDGLVINPGQEA